MDPEYGPAPSNSGGYFIKSPSVGVQYTSNPYPMSPPAISYVVQPIIGVGQVSMQPNYTHAITYSQRPQFDHQKYSNTAVPDPAYPTLYSPTSSYGNTSYSHQAQGQAPNPYVTVARSNATMDPSAVYPFSPAIERPESQHQPQYIPLSQRSLFINHIPKTATEAQIRDLVHMVVAKPKTRAANSDRDSDCDSSGDTEDDDDDVLDDIELIEELVLPLHSDKTRRGHAILTLSSEGAAIQAIRGLNGVMWKGETLSVRWDKVQPTAGSGGGLTASATSPRKGSAKSKSTYGAKGTSSTVAYSQSSKGRTSITDGKNTKAGRDGKVRKEGGGGAAEKRESRDEPPSPVVADSGAWNENFVIRSAGPGTGTGGRSGGSGIGERRHESSGIRGREKERERRRR